MWVGLLIAEFTIGLNRALETLGLVLWGLFVAEFVLRLSLAPDRGRFLLKNWLSMLALALPALRAFRIFRAVRVLRAARAVRGIRLVRVVTTFNRGMRALARTLGRRGFGYVVLLTVAVVLLGAAGMLQFEGERLGGYPYALWWTTMLVMTVGSDFWPRTAEGRFLAALLAIYAFSIFGYIAATLASYFIERDTADREAPTIASLQEEVRALREEIRALARGQASGLRGRVTLE